MAAIFDKAGKDLLAARISEEKAKPVTTWVWTLGGDTHRTLTYPERRYQYLPPSGFIRNPGYPLQLDAFR